MAFWQEALFNEQVCDDGRVQECVRSGGDVSPVPTGKMEYLDEREHESRVSTDEVRVVSGYRGEEGGRVEGCRSDGERRRGRGRGVGEKENVRDVQNRNGAPWFL